MTYQTVDDDRDHLLAPRQLITQPNWLFLAPLSILVLVLMTLTTAWSYKPAPPAAPRSGKVIDASTGKAIAGALITQGNTVIATDEEGNFPVNDGVDTLGVRAYGYLRREEAVSSIRNDTPIALEPFMPKAIYLSLFGIGNSKLRQSAIDLMMDTELNALVIELKSERGMVAFPSSVPLAAGIGAQKTITIKDLNLLTGELHAKGLYAIARIVVFKDEQLVSAREDLAVKTAGGSIWRDTEGLAWSDPFRKAVWSYNIDLAVEAARAGFDEIQFDYVRFPDEPGLRYAAANTEANRVKAITEFLAEARTRLIPYNVFLAVDVFGYVLWNADDTAIGQKIENIAPIADYVSPMLYPSAFQFGIPGYANPVQHPREVVFLSLEKARQRTGLPAVRFRPWLQAFRDYAFDKTPFRGEQIRTEIDAAECFGSDGWMLWNPRNTYTRQGVLPKAGVGAVAKK